MKKEELKEYLELVKKESTELEEESYSPYTEDFITGSRYITVNIYMKDFDKPIEVLIHKILDTVVIIVKCFVIDEEKKPFIDTYQLISLKEIVYITYEY